MCASQNGDIEVVQLLIERGAHVNISNNVRYITVGLCLYLCLCACVNACMHVYICVVVWPSG